MRACFFFLQGLLLLSFLPAKAHQGAGYLEFPNHSRAALLASHSHISTEDTLWIALHIQLDPEWHTYWKNPGDSGAAPILEMSANDPAVTFSEIHWPTPSRISTPPLMTYGYEGEVLLRAQVKGLSEKGKNPLEITWDAEWLVCKVECIPAFHSFKVTVERSAQSRKSDFFNLITAPSFQTYPASEKLQASYSESQGEVNVSLDLKAGYFDFFPESTLTLTTDVPEQRAGGFALKTRGPLQSQEIRGLLLTGDGKAQYVTAEPIKASWGTFWWAAFLGGLLLNLMPCVFPIISLKVFSALRQEGPPLKARLSHLSFVAGVLVTFLAVALVLAGLRAAGHSLGWGFQLQSPGFLLFLIFLFFVLSLNFLGLYEMRLPGLKTGSGSDGPIGSFLAGALAVVVASPCTAPFMGGAMGFAMTQATGPLLLIFSGLGLGFAFPYVVLAFFPGLLSRLPKSGPWLQTFKEFMFFPMLWTTLWLIWIFAQIAGMTAAVGVMVACSLVGALFWWQHRARSKVSLRAGQVAFLLLALATLAVSWERGASYQPASPLADKSFIPWTPFDTASLEKLLASGQPVFVSFTASWCITCKVNEQVTFQSDEVRRFVENRGIHMVVADWTRRDAAITQFMQQYQRISVPFYLFWTGGQRQPVVLPEILTPQIFMNAIQKHQDKEEKI